MKFVAFYFFHVKVVLKLVDLNKLGMDIVVIKISTHKLQFGMILATYFALMSHPLFVRR